ncbi:MAG TPA: branched-chain amino acid ABC transporter permease [Fibrobacteria bacterium]|nr:branched-chain amino acid ABC transporter permease [Fibrobacteria bacterium]
MKRLLWIAGTLAALALLQWAATAVLLDGPVRQGPYYYQILILAGINIVLAVSLNLTNGIAGQFSIGHAGFFAVGAYVSASVSHYGGPALRSLSAFLPPVGQDAVVLLSALAAAAVATALAGLLVGIPSLRLRGDYLAIVTLGFGEIIRVLILNVDAVGGARGFSGIPKLSNFFWVYLLVAASIATTWNLVRSSYGRAFLAIRENEIAAQAMGVDVTRHKVLAFVISSMFAGLAGCLFGHYTMYLHTNSFTFVKSFEIIIMIAIGGLGSIEGAVLGAVLLTVLPEAFRGFESYRMILYSLALILIMIYRPQGILGQASVIKRLGARLAARAGAKAAGD